MPLLKDFGSFHIRMYFRDHNPPHVHAVSPDETVLLAIADGSIVRGAIRGESPRPAQDWIAQNRDMLLVKWAESQK
jgi:hypothetical protein